MKMRFFVFFLQLAALQVFAQQPVVHFQGQLQQLHRWGNAQATVQVDSVVTPFTFALGTVANLQGEIFVWQGRPFVAGVTGAQKRPFVTKDVSQLKATFLVYAHVPRWDTLHVTFTANNRAQFEQELSRIAAGHGLDTLQPFPFLVLGQLASGKGHILFADTPREVIAPDSLFRFTHFNCIQQQKAQLVGFYARNHAGLITHYDSFVHMHYRMYNKYQAGHLDEVAFDGQTQVLLLLPQK